MRKADINSVTGIDKSADLLTPNSPQQQSFDEYYEGASTPKCGDGMWTHLHLAAKGGHIDTAKLLIQHKPDFIHYLDYRLEKRCPCFIIIIIHLF